MNTLLLSDQHARMLANGTFSATVTEAGRALLTPDEIMALPGDQQLLFIQGVRPVLARKVRYFRDQLRIS